MCNLSSFLWITWCSFFSSVFSVVFSTTRLSLLASCSLLFSFSLRLGLSLLTSCSLLSSLSLRLLSVGKLSSISETLSLSGCLFSEVSKIFSLVCSFEGFSSFFVSDLSSEIDSTDDWSLLFWSFLSMITPNFSFSSVSYTHLTLPTKRIV